jgi:hypothetical protein
MSFCQDLAPEDMRLLYAGKELEDNTVPIAVSCHRDQPSQASVQRCCICTISDLGAKCVLGLPQEIGIADGATVYFVRKLTITATPSMPCLYA